MAAESDNITPIWFTYTGEEVIPEDATHIVVQGMAVIPERTFEDHPNIVEVICHEDVTKIEECAFSCCYSLRRVIMPGVKEVRYAAFECCYVLSDVECGELEIVGDEAFSDCKSLRRINLPSTRIVQRCSFYRCSNLTHVKFSSKLERIEEYAFGYCGPMERIAIPLKNGLITRDNVFKGCTKLKHVELVKGAVHETIATLYFKKWRNDVYGEIDSINRILPTYFSSRLRCSRKARAIRTWVRSVLKKVMHYQKEHQLIVGEAGLTLKSALPQEIVMNHVLPFLELPSHTKDDK